MARIISFSIETFSDQFFPKWRKALLLFARAVAAIGQWGLIGRCGPEN
jgi:hypothetical protein